MYQRQGGRGGLGQRGQRGVQALARLEGGQGEQIPAGGQAEPGRTSVRVRRDGPDRVGHPLADDVQPVVRDRQMCLEVGGDGPGRHDHGVGPAGRALTHLPVPPRPVRGQGVRMGPRHRVMDRHHEPHPVPPGRDEQRRGVHHSHPARRRPVATRPGGGKPPPGQR